MTTLKAIKAALEAATPGPWRYHHKYRTVETDSGEVCTVTSSTKQVQLDADGLLIADSPTWLAWCLEQIAARDALLRRYGDTCDCKITYIDVDGQCVYKLCKLCSEARKVMEESNG